MITPPRLNVAQGADTPVVLQSIRIDTEISGSRALTAVEMTFFNPNRRILEGELQFPLLDGQQVSGFALDIDGKLRYAVPVEKAKGQQVFEDVIHTRIDPALLQVTAGNNYKLRVYPLPAQGTRRVLIRYAKTLPVAGNLRRHRLPHGVCARFERVLVARGGTRAGTRTRASGHAAARLVFPRARGGLRSGSVAQGFCGARSCAGVRIAGYLFQAHRRQRRDAIDGTVTHGEQRPLAGGRTIAGRQRHAARHGVVSAVARPLPESRAKIGGGPGADGDTAAEGP